MEVSRLCQGNRLILDKHTASNIAKSYGSVVEKLKLT